MGSMTAAFIGILLFVALKDIASLLEKINANLERIAKAAGKREQRPRIIQPGVSWQRNRPSVVAIRRVG